MSQIVTHNSNSGMLHKPLRDFFALYFFSLPIIFAGYIISAYRWIPHIEQISFAIADGPQHLGFIGKHSFGDFQQLVHKQKMLSATRIIHT